MLPQRRVRASLGGTVLAALLAGAFGHVDVATRAPGDLFDEIYERGRVVDASWKTLTASFVETSTSSLLAIPLVARGTLAVARPDRVVMNYVEPDRRTVVINGNTLTMVWAARGIRRDSNISATQRRIQKYFVNRTPQELRRHFVISARIAPDRPDTWHVALVPTEKRIQQGVTAIDLWVDRRSLLLAAMAMTFKNGDRKLLEFSDLQINPQLAPTIFSPPGT